MSKNIKIKLVELFPMVAEIVVTVHDDFVDTDENRAKVIERAYLAASAECSLNWQPEPNADAVVGEHEWLGDTDRVADFIDYEKT
jgi:hypothetical protein